MKTFRNNAELAHAYANATHDSGKANNMYFIGNIIYSYGSHYEIAHRVYGNNGIPVVFVNANGYSTSTGRHTNHVWQAIPDGILTFKVPFAEGYGHCNYFRRNNLPAIIERIALNVKNLLHDQLNARSFPHHFYNASSLYGEMVEICELFGLECPPKPENWEKARNKAEELKATENTRKRISELKAIEKQKENLSKWLNYDYNGQLYDIPVHIRISRCGEFVETTKGARVTMNEAKVLLSRLRAGHDVKGYNLEGFKVIENTPDHVKIGCHVINWDVINKTFSA